MNPYIDQQFQGHTVSSGIYISRLEFMGQVQMNRMTLLK